MEQVAGDNTMTEGALGGTAAASVVSTPTAVAGGLRPKPSGPLSRTAIATVLQYWKAFDLDSKRVMLDTQGTTMKTEKENSLRSRKKLAETTKTFRKLPDTEKVAGIGGLLRAYQEEIDSLTRRAKYSENAFFMLYKNLYAAPDPVPSLESVNDLSKVNSLEDENKRLKRELHEYEVEFSTLKNQDITIRKLEDQVASMEREMEDVVHRKAAEKCKELEDQLSAKELEFTQLKVDFDRQLDHKRGELRDAFSRLDALQSELFAFKQRSGLAKSTLDAEMEAISQDAIVMQTLRLENAQLKKQIDELLSLTSSDDAGHSARLGAQGSSGSLLTGSTADLSQKDATIAGLRQDIVRLTELVQQMEEQAAVEKAKYNNLTQQAQRTQDELTAQLSRPTLEQYNEVLHQLRVLQQLEYNIVDEGVHLSSSGGGSSETDASQATTEIEKILVSRVRRLEHALQQRDLALETRTNELARAQEELQRKNDIIQEQVELVRSLEETVSTLESRRRGTNGVGGPTDVGSAILLDAVEGDTTTGTTASGGIGADSKMFEIVRGQRDRFRERMKELEADKNKIEALSTSYRSQVARLENDNMQLYQKIRYLQSYRGGNSGKGNMRVTPGGNGGGLPDLEGGGDVEARYKSMYDDKMNPFQQFNKIESQQRYTNLNTVDKILLNSAKLFLGHRITRNIAFGYILLLHFLVFATLYTFMHGCGISNE